MTEERTTADLLSAILIELKRQPQGISQKEIYLYCEKIFEAAPEPIIIADTQGRIIKVNESFSQTFGFFPEEVLGEYLDTVAVPAELKKDSLALISLALRGERVAQETTRLHRDGHPIPVSLVAGPVMIDGQVAAIFAIYHDLSRLKKIEQELILAEKKFQDIAQSSVDWVWEVDEKWRFIFVSDKVKSILGYKPEEITGKSFFDLMPLAEAEKIKAIVTSLAEKAEPIVGLETCYETRTEEKAYILINGLPIFGPYGKVIGYRGTARDITSRSLAEERLQKEMTRFAAMIEGMQEGILFADANNTVIEINNYFLNLLKRERKTVVGQSLLALEPIASLANLNSLVEKFREIPFSPAYSLEQSLFGLEMFVRFQPVYYQNNYDGLIVNLIDVSELVKARNQAQAAERIKGEFLANISHEIRTPLNGILGMVNLFLETELTPEQKEYLTGIKNSAEALLDLINDILDFSKIEEKKIVLEKTVFNLEDLVFEAIAPLTFDAHRKKLELTCNLPPSLPMYVEGDQGKIRQILINLLSNAIKFTEKGEVTLSVELKGREDNSGLFCFEVADTGIGIPKEKQEIIFRAFTQVDGSMTRRFGGTGLGLAICQELVSALGGRIWVESEEGKGSRFQVELKLKIEPVPEAQQTEDRQAQEALSQTSALIIDDNAASQQSLKTWLTFWGVKAEETSSGEDAVVLLERSLQLETPFDFILLDSFLPGTGSFFLRDFLRQDPNRAGRTILLLASPDHKVDISLWQKVGIKTFITKPPRPRELRDALLVILGKKQPRLLMGLPPVQEEKPPQNKYRILLAEDNLVNQKVACFILERHGHEVIAVKDGQEALEALEKGVFDLVLLDVQMPRLDGFAATREIRKRERASKAHLPIVAMTAHALKGDKEKCLAAGMDDYVPKPLRADELLAVIEKTINRLKKKR
ncbi:MAG: PAS domain S-box protein [Candidatus Aminicenantales bacterium]